MLSRLVRTASRAVGTDRSMSTLETLAFDNRALKKLPIDQEKDNYVRSVPGACYSRVDPTPVKAPKLVAHSDEALDLLGLSPSEVARAEFVEYFGGCRVLPGSEPAAHCYCGHQFGHFSGQLGDGCAMYLGEVTNARGERWELQLKGSGKTPYSRHADGRKVLRSSIREFLCSEAMHHLGVPTTRAGSCVTSDSYVQRDLLYNGNVIDERCTVISRIAPSFIRFGSFEIFKPRDPTTGRAGPSVGRGDILHQMLDYVTESYYPEIHSNHISDRVKRTGALYREICSLTAKLVALWQCVGFCHGVLNTDNMSIVGVTIDYGPFGFLDRYDPGHICNGSDDGGRYSYKKQPSICRWNLSKLAEAFSVCLSPEDTKRGLEIYDEVFRENFLEKMRKKLGLVRVVQPEDSDLVESFLETMQITGCDFTNGFRSLNSLDLSKLNDRRHVEDSVTAMVDQCCAPSELVKSYKPGMPPQQLEMFLALQQQSPMLLAQLGISPEFLKREQDKMKEMEKLKKTTSEEKKKLDLDHWTHWMETYRSRLQHEAAGLSPADLEQAQAQRLKAMDDNNPRFILRNHIAQKAIQLAEDGDFTEVRRVLHLLKHPYSEDIDMDGELWRDTIEPAAAEGPSPPATAASSDGDQLTSVLKTYTSRPPDWALGLCVT